MNKENIRDELLKKKDSLKLFLNRNQPDIIINEHNEVFKLSPQSSKQNPSVSILIPTRDNHSVLDRCISSLLEKTDYDNYEIIILNNQSTQSNTIDYLNKIQEKSRIKVVQYNRPFNYSAINNYGARLTNTDLICLLNDDTAVINPEWLAEMAMFAIKPEIGCVGAKLYYSNGKIQHGGVILGVGHVAGHAHRYFPGDSAGYMNRLICTQFVSAVTGACLLVKRDIYNEVGGLNEKNLTVAYNDIDFCIRVKLAGYNNLWTPNAQLFHYESLTRGADNTFNKKRRYYSEVKYMRTKWRKILKDDPYYHPHLTNKREDFSFKF